MATCGGEEHCVRLRGRSAEKNPLPFIAIQTHRCPARALKAVVHTMLVVGYHLLKTGHGHREPEGNYLEQIDKDQLQRYFVKRPQKLGFKVTVEPSLEAA